MPLTVRGNVLSTLTRLQLLVQDGTAAAPSIAFTNRPQSGLYRAGAGAVGIAVDGVEIVRISSAGLTSTYFTGNGSQLTGIGNLSVSNVQITDSGFMPLDDTAVSNSGGYLLVNGTGFREPLGMLLGASIAPTSVTVVNTTQARVQTPAMPNGTYPLWVFTDTSSTIKNAALHVSPVPIWSTATTLSNVFKYTAFTQSLVATEPLGSNITYTLASGSSLPANVSLTSNGVLAGNIVTDPGNTTAYNFVVQATDTQFQNIPRSFGLTSIRVVTSGDSLSYSDLYMAVRSIGVVTSTELPVTGGTLTINSQSLGSYDYVCKKSSMSLASFTASDWFTSTADTRSAWIKVCGDLTIDSGVTFTPSVRKLFTVIHVTGNLTVNGTISMTARGANHSATTATAIAIAQGTYSGIVNPNVPAAGGTGATAVSSGSGNVNGNSGEMRSDGATGGGGGGGIRNNGFAGTIVTGGAGATGTSFSGGPGGGGAWGGNASGTSATGGSGGASGGSGGAGAVTYVGATTDPSGQGGAGNPGGAGVGVNAVSGTSGTGGILIIIVEGSILGSGSIVANGSKGGEYTGASLLGTSGGGGSGGGSVTVFAKTDGSTITVTAAGGAGGMGTGNCSSGVCQGGSAGAGGNGTARKLLL